MLHETLLDNLFDLLLGVGFTFEIRMVKELIDSESVLRSVLKHLGNQIYKVFVVIS